MQLLTIRSTIFEYGDDPSMSKYKAGNFVHRLIVPFCAFDNNKTNKKFGAQQLIAILF